MESVTEELIRGKLIKEGYSLLVVSRDAAKPFENAKIEGSATLDYTGKYNLKIIARNGDENTACLHYNSTPARCVVASFIAFGQNKLWKKPVRADDFKTYVSNAFDEYCSNKGMEGESAREIKKLSLSESQIGHLLNRDGKWFRMLYDKTDDRIRLKCGLRNVILPKI
jgi:hypothetical protein